MLLGRTGPSHDLMEQVVYRLHFIDEDSEAREAEWPAPGHTGSFALQHSIIKSGRRWESAQLEKEVASISVPATVVGPSASEKPTRQGPWY